MKMYKKSDLSIIDGMLVSDTTGDIIIPDVRIVKQANLLEDIKQKASYLSAQPAATKAPSLDGFERLSIKDKVIEGAKFEATTPLMDIEAAKTMKLMEELDDMMVVDKANEFLGNFTDLLSFVNNDFVVDCGGDKIIPFDTPTLGSVLELKQKDITEVIAMASGLHGDKDCADCDDTDCSLHPDHKSGSWNVITGDDMDDEDIETLLGIIAKHDDNAAKIINDQKDCE